jgi:4-amino-4-deoxy-L-arabinose transferase-like glycosyltransferase/membrane-associated phospholipid phosphatase
LFAVIPRPVYSPGVTVWFYALDAGLFQWLNHALSNPVFDVLMPWLSGNAAFVPAAALAIGALLWRGGLRGRLCVLLLALVIALTDGVVCKQLKKAVGRERPFMSLPDARVLVGKGASGSFPSSHAANWCAALVVLGAYYRRSYYATAPLAVAVSFSRVYNGVHYPGDILAGMLLGAGTAWLTLQAAERTWRWVGGRWFPLWQPLLPSLLYPDQASPASAPPGGGPELAAETERHWLRLGYLAIAIMLVTRWLYIASGTAELSEDEAYQWTWSKHLALSYYSKPPLIAYTQFLGTSLWGDTAFGVRFFAPVISAILGWLLLRFLAREVNARAGFFLLLIANAAPLMVAGSVLMTIDPLSVLFWVAAMVAGWGALRDNRTSQWAWVGWWMGLGFLSKYTALLQWVSWGVLFALWPQARARLRGKGPWIALAVNLLCTLPVLLWNLQHDWITVAHVASNGGLNRAWKFSHRFFVEFTGAEWGLLNPVFFIAAIWAAARFWPRWRRRPLLLYLFCMGAPLFLFYWLYTVRYRVLLNWIAPSVLPLFALMVVYWEERWRQGARRVARFMWAGLILGWAVTILMLFPALMTKNPYFPKDARLDPLRRVRAWSDTAQVVEVARQKLLAEGKPAFIIADHYGITGHFSFYIPEARAAVTREPLVFYRSSDAPENQFYFWPGYQNRKGQNAIFVQENDTPQRVPERIEREFASVEDLGLMEIKRQGLVYRRMQLWACRGLK